MYVDSGDGVDGRDRQSVRHGARQERDERRPHLSDTRQAGQGRLSDRSVETYIKSPSNNQQNTNLTLNINLNTGWAISLLTLAIF